MITYIIVTLLFAVDIFILFKIGVIKLPKKGPKIIPINPNTSVRECQFCGKLPAKLSRDGYYACPSCTITKLRQVG